VSSSTISQIFLLFLELLVLDSSLLWSSRISKSIYVWGNSFCGRSKILGFRVISALLPLLERFAPQLSFFVVFPHPPNPPSFFFVVFPHSFLVPITPFSVNWCLDFCSIGFVPEVQINIILIWEFGSFRNYWYRSIGVSQFQEFCSFRVFKERNSKTMITTHLLLFKVFETCRCCNSF
jgi:hypothetical protein